ncbi:hypothetical protein [Tateyamaria sp. SN6-1]|uniref:hypothetical protein n=1 Tax=Tateyamaria sp. SN6-1 TaxID=3092148 RepID=UPI0039F56AC6
MTTFSRRHALGLMGAATVSACAPVVQTGALSEDPFEGGIGGTGIVGTMIGAGSVLINGLRVEIPDAVRIVENGGIGGTGALMPGRAMTIVARTRRDRMEALRIDVEDPLIGTLRRTSSGLRLNGTPVTIEPGAVGGTLVGRRVAASGVWQRDGSLRASLVQPSGLADSVSGTVAGDPATGWRIGQTLIQPPAGSSLIAGQYASASGTFNGTSLIARTLRQGRFRPGTSLRQLSVEGYLERIDTAPGFRIAGLGHSFARRLDLAPLAGSRAVFFGPYDGLFAARRAVFLPEGVGKRRSVLRPSDGSAFAPALTGPQARRIGTL